MTTKLLVRVQWVLLGSVLIFQTGTASAAPQEKLYTYKVRIAATQNSCEDEAKLLSDRFQRATKLSSLLSECLGTQSYVANEQTYSVYSLKLTYSSPRILPGVSFQYGSTSNYPIQNEMGDYYGIYRTYSACLGDLARREAQFEERTQLIPISSFCSKAKVDDTYVLQLEGFGTPKERLHVFDAKFIDPYSVTPIDSAVIADFKQFIQRQGVSLLEVSGSKFFFYREKPLNLNRRVMLYGQSLEVCSSQLSEVDQIFKNVKVSDWIAKCIPYSARPNAPKTYSLVSLWVGGGYLSSSKTNDRYYSYSECTADRSAALRSYEASMGIKPHGALCLQDSLSSDQGSFAMEIY